MFSVFILCILGCSVVAIGANVVVPLCTLDLNCHNFSSVVIEAKRLSFQELNRQQFFIHAVFGNSIETIFKPLLIPSQFRFERRPIINQLVAQLADKLRVNF